MPSKRCQAFSAAPLKSNYPSKRTNDRVLNCEQHSRSLEHCYIPMRFIHKTTLIGGLATPLGIASFYGVNELGGWPKLPICFAFYIFRRPKNFSLDSGQTFKILDTISLSANRRCRPRCCGHTPVSMCEKNSIGSQYAGLIS